MTRADRSLKRRTGAIRRSGRLAAALVVALGLLGTGAFTASPASATDVRVLHWNIKGGCSDFNTTPYPGACGNVDVANYLSFLVAVSPIQPWSISLNEVCAPQFMAFAAALGDIGYHWVWVPTNYNVNPNCGVHGNAMFQRGVVMSGSLSDRAYSTQNLHDEDVRHITCNFINTVYLGVRENCVSHLAPKVGGEGPTQVQDNEAAYYAAIWHPTIATTVGLDRNTECGRPGVSCGGWPFNWDSDFRTVDPLYRSTFRAGAPIYELDWMFGSKAGISGANDASAACNVGDGTGNYHSDHCIIVGDFVS